MTFLKMNSKINHCYYKKNIINRFLNNVKDKKVCLEEYNKKHCGSEGFWLEKQMNIKHNSDNKPDIFGYEMKKESSKITFGDFSASEYLFSKNRKILEQKNNWSKNQSKMSRIEFINYFGQPNCLKNNRFSWSGSCVPKYNSWNFRGQMLKFDENLNLCVLYSHQKDQLLKQDYRSSYPDLCQKITTIAVWSKDKLEKHINKKFNKNGFFICKKVEKKYQKICFGRPFDFNYFVKNIKNKNIIFDSGMYVGNSRNYSQFRSFSKKFWNNLIDEEYP